MGKILRNIAVVALVLLSFTGCFKKVTLETTLRIKALVEEVSGGERVAADGCYAYLYYNVSETDTIMSYEDAAARIITNKLKDEKRSEPDVVGEAWSAEGSAVEYMSLYQEQSSALVVVVYPAAKMYAYMYRKSEAENLPDTYLTLIFHRWKTGKPYNEGSKEGYKWIVFPSEEPETPEPEQPTEPETPTEPEQPTNPEQPETPTEPETPEGDEPEQSTNN